MTELPGRNKSNAVIDDLHDKIKSIYLKRKITMKKKKANYYPPTVEVKIVQLEQGVAASSATITPGGPTGSNLNPEI